MVTFNLLSKASNMSKNNINKIYKCSSPIKVKRRKYCQLNNLIDNDSLLNKTNDEDKNTCFV